MDVDRDMESYTIDSPFYYDLIVTWRTGDKHEIIRELSWDRSMDVFIDKFYVRYPLKTVVDVISLRGLELLVEKYELKSFVLILGDGRFITFNGINFTLDTMKSFCKMFIEIQKIIAPTDKLEIRQSKDVKVEKTFCPVS